MTLTKKAEATRQHILDTGHQLVLRKGFAALGLLEILKTCNVPKGSFYHYFPSKEAFGCALLQQYVDGYGRKVAAMFTRFDVLLTSTLGSAPIAIGALQGVAPGAGGLARRAFMPNTRIFNLTGQPAMSVPLGWGEDGLPIGLQFVGRMGDEATLFRLAGQLEQARPWVGRRPTGVSFTNLDVAEVERPLGA